MRKVMKVQMQSLTKDLYLRKIKIGKHVNSILNPKPNKEGSEDSEKKFGLITHLSYLRGNSFSHIFTLNFYCIWQ